jgi:hypothetical protein
MKITCLLFLLIFITAYTASSQTNDKLKDLQLLVLDIKNKKMQTIEIPWMEKLATHSDTLTEDSIYHNGYAIYETTSRITTKQSKYILGSAYFIDSNGDRWHLNFYIYNGDGVYADLIVLLDNESAKLKIPEYQFYFKGTYMDIFEYPDNIFHIIKSEPIKNQSQFSLELLVKK